MKQRLHPRLTRSAWAAWCAIVLGWLIAATPALGQLPETAAERSVKAAYIYRFLPYIEWPADTFARPAAPVVIGVVAADEVARELELAIAGRQLEQRPVIVRRIGSGDSLAGLHVIYIGRTALRNSILARARVERGLLTITEVDGGLDYGAMVNFVPIDGKLRFEVAVDHAERAGIKFSSRLLAVATRVRANG